jgi:serine/threonine protein kinase
MGSFHVRFIAQSYAQDESFLSVGAPEPSSRSHRAIAYTEDEQWHLKITFHGNLLPLPGAAAGSVLKAKDSKLKRTRDLRILIESIDFASRTLLDDTVTEVKIAVGSVTASNGTLPLRDLGRLAETNFSGLGCLVYSVSEDDSRVIYPLHQKDSSTREVWETDIQTAEVLSDAVSRVTVGTEEYVYKRIDRPFYTRRDTATIEQELQNLKRLHQAPNIAQLAGVVISRNPYCTRNREDCPTVLRGLLLQYYPGGTLEELLERAIAPQMCSKWTQQIAAALSCLHHKHITHMDLKPSNIVM